MKIKRTLRYEDFSGEFKNGCLMSFQPGLSEDFNRRLARIILEKEKELVAKFEGPRTRLTGPHMVRFRGRYNLLAWDYPECAYLKDVISSCLKIFVKKRGYKKVPTYIHCWANVAREGWGLGLHNHASLSEYGYSHSLKRVSLRHDVSGVYYVNSPLHGDRTGHTFYQTQGEYFLEVTPRAGQLNMFPADIMHFVAPYRGRRRQPRISIAFDIRVTPPSSVDLVPIRLSARGSLGR